eukprot:Partr_v1_DN27649_c0_g1_i5_m64953 putative CWF19-like 2, cell cycle control (S. pombe)
MNMLKSILALLNADGRLVDFGTERDNLSHQNSNYKVASLMRAEKMSMRTYDDDYAHRIASDSQFKDNIDYLDDNSSKLSRGRYPTQLQKRQTAINESVKTQQALDGCWYCFKDNQEPIIPAISSGTKIYLGLAISPPLVPGHCLIVPHEHYCSTLECS